MTFQPHEHESPRHMMENTNNKVALTIGILAYHSRKATLADVIIVINKRHRKP